MDIPAPQRRYPSKFRVFSWSLFDFGNTAFSVIIVTVLYSNYFTGYVTGGRESLWGLSVSLSMIFAALLSPPLGAAADYGRHRKLFLFLFTMVSVVCTALLYTVDQGMIATGMLLFILANIGFEGGLVFYDAFLPGLTPKSTYGRVSGYGFAMGYLGALAVLVVVNMLLPADTDPRYLEMIRTSFVVAAGFFFVFSLPLFLFVKEPAREPGTRLSLPELTRLGIRRSADTFTLIFRKQEFPSVARFLVAFFIYNDGIITVIAFAAIFARNVLQMSTADIILFFAIVQTSAVFGSLVFGVITDKIGPKRTIIITLILWIGISIGGYFITTATMFYVIATIAGVAIGSSQSASRSLMALLTPPDREAEFFGFYDGLCGKASAVVGPLVYGLIADLTSERLAALVLGVFFIAGLILLQGVKEPERTVRSPAPDIEDGKAV